MTEENKTKITIVPLKDRILSIVGLVLIFIGVVFYFLGASANERLEEGAMSVFEAERLETAIATYDVLFWCFLILGLIVVVAHEILVYLRKKGMVEEK